MSLWSLYFPTIIAAMVSAPVLGFIGVQLAARAQTVQSLTASQGAVLGILLASTWVEWFGPLGLGLVTWSLGFALLFAALVFALCDQVARSPRWADPSSFHMGFYVLLIALTAGLGSVFGHIDSHQAQRFFGELALLNERQSWILSGVFFIGGMVFLRCYRVISANSFFLASFAIPIQGAAEKRIERAFLWTALLLVCLSIQGFGLLYTLGALFIPGLFASLKKPGLRSFYLQLVGTGTLGSLLGFSFSLYTEFLPTVPTIIFFFLLFETIFVGLSRRRA